VHAPCTHWTSTDAVKAVPSHRGRLQLGLLDEAQAQLHQALGTLRDMGDWKWMNNSLLGLALVAGQQADVETMALSQVFGRN